MGKLSPPLGFIFIFKVGGGLLLQERIVPGSKFFVRGTPLHIMKSADFREVNPFLLLLSFEKID